MKRRKIFTKKNKIFKIKNFIFFLIFFIFLYLYNIFFINNKYFIIEPNKNKFYIIPKDPGGKKIPDYGINILENNFKIDKNENKIHENYNDNANLDNLIYSLQLSASSSLDEIKGKKIFYSKKLKNSQNQLFIVKFDSSLGPYFLLLYMNFTTRDSAKILCDDLKTKDINCLIVNVKNL